jgi:hypothetical protein
VKLEITNYLIAPFVVCGVFSTVGLDSSSLGKGMFSSRIKTRDHSTALVYMNG